MNKKEEKILLETLPAIDKLYELVNKFDDKCLDYLTKQLTTRNMNAYKKNLLDSLDIIQSNVDILLKMP